MLVVHSELFIFRVVDAFLFLFLDNGDLNYWDLNGSLYLDFFLFFNNWGTDELDQVLLWVFLRSNFLGVEDNGLLLFLDDWLIINVNHLGELLVDLVNLEGRVLLDVLAGGEQG